MNEVSTYGHIPEKFIKQPQDSCIKMVSMQFHHDEIEEWKVLNRNKKTSNHRRLLGFYPPSEALIIFGRVMKGVESYVHGIRVSKMTFEYMPGGKNQMMCLSHLERNAKCFEHNYGEMM